MLKKSHIYKIQHQLQMYDLSLAEMKIINNEKQIMIHDMTLSLMLIYSF